jgi:RimJ/RimL family protein N-acetyltransferase
LKVSWVHWDESPELFRALEFFVSERVWGVEREFGKGRAMVVSDDGTVKAVLIYHNYDSDAGVIEISGASDDPRWLNREVLGEMFWFPFHGLDCQAVVMRVDAENTRLLRILKAYGFKRYDVPRLRGRNKVEALHVLSDDDWRANKFNR